MQVHFEERQDEMTAKEYLMQVRQKDEDIDKQIEYIDSLKSILTHITAKFDDDVRVQQSVEPDKFSKIFAQIDEEQRKLDRMTDDFVDFKAEVMRQIYMLKNKNQIDILTKHYIEYASLVQISESMGFSYDYVIEVHGKALKEFKKTHM